MCLLADNFSVFPTVSGINDQSQFYNMDIKILAFGIAKDILGATNLSVQMPGEPTVGQLKAHLCRSYPAFEKLASFAIALNTEYAEDRQAIHPGDEVVIIPPVSGG